MTGRRLFILAAVLVLSAATAVAAAELTPKESLGKFLFFDTNLSTPRGQSCSECHLPEVGWVVPDAGINEHGAVHPGAIHHRFGSRRPPTIAYSTFSPDFHFDEAEEHWVGGQRWDGRIVNMVEQAGLPFFNPLEENIPGVRQLCIKVRQASYADLFREVFGPDSLDWVKNAEVTHRLIAEAITAYAASGETNEFRSRYDYYLDGQVELSEQEIRGLELFEGKAGCAGCHPCESGPYSAQPLFTSFTYANLGVPRNPENPFYDMRKQFNPDGASFVDLGLGGFLSDADYPPEVYEPELGKMKVPTLRNVDRRLHPDFPKAYMHNGVFKSLTQVVDFMNTRDIPGRWPPAEVDQNITAQVGNLGLTPLEVEDLVAFLKTLSDGYFLPD